MKLGGLLLLVGSVALWTGLPAAPPRRTPGQPPLSPSSAPGEAPQDRISQEEEATLACTMAQEEVQKMPQGKKSRADGERVAEEPQFGKGGSLPTKAAGPASTGKLISKTDPQLERPPVNHLEVESSAGPAPAKKPQEPSERDPSLDTGPQLGGSPVSRERRLSGGNVPRKQTSGGLGRHKLASMPALPNLGTWNPVWDPNNVATSGGKLNTSKKPTPSSPCDKPTSGTGKPTSAERPEPGSGHSIQGKPKPGSDIGPPAHEGPPSGHKPASNSGPKPPGRPLAGEKPSSPLEHEKHPSPDESTSPEKPEHEVEKESKPEKEAEEKKESGEELFDDDEEEEEEGKEKEEGTAGGNKDGDDAFDKELDYGLNNLPFDAYSYHDAWSDDGMEVADVGLPGALSEAEVTALSEAEEANSDGKPIFDAWGDLVGGSRP